jgi:hypothetical protein
MLIISGNTIRLQATFADENGEAVSIGDPVCRIYDGYARKIDEITPTESGTGNYITTYPVPKPGYYYFEFAGIIGGKTYLHRRKFKSEFSE